MLTTQQLATLKTDILGNADALALYNVGDRAGLAALYNADAAPQYIVWRTSIARDEVLADGFDFTQVDNLTTGQARILIGCSTTPTAQ